MSIQQQQKKPWFTVAWQVDSTVFHLHHLKQVGPLVINFVNTFPKLHFSMQFMRFCGSFQILH